MGKESITGILEEIGIHEKQSINRDMIQADRMEFYFQGYERMMKENRKFLVYTLIGMGIVGAMALTGGILTIV